MTGALVLVDERDDSELGAPLWAKLHFRGHISDIVLNCFSNLFQCFNDKKTILARLETRSGACQIAPLENIICTL